MFDEKKRKQLAGSGEEARCDVVVIGAGALGCAIARELSRNELKTVVLEKNADVAGETTGRNSAVVHAGFNNRQGSLMARFCVEGNEGFEEVCEELDVPYRRTGKLVVAFDAEARQSLEGLLSQGLANGCRGLEILEGERLETLLKERGMEDEENRFKAALWSPRTAITNPFLYCVALAENALANGVDFYLDTKVTGITPAEGEGARFTITTENTRSGQDGPVFSCRYLINCAGLMADRIAAMAGMPADTYRIYPCRGEYFILDRKATREEDLLSMPIYPAPQKKIGGLGVHLTPTIEGNIIIGPSAEYLDDADSRTDDVDSRTDYACTQPVMEKLMREAVQLMPAVKEVQPIGNYAGIRPKQAPPGEGGYHDYVIQAEEEVPGLIDLIGIESPGLTASLPIARYVCRMIGQMEEECGLGLKQKADFCGSRQGILRFREQTLKRQAELIEQDPAYGEIICRCQKITRREICQAIENPLGAVSIAAIKYRAWATTGRCNGGYCLPRIVRILKEDYGVPPEEIRYRNTGSEMFTGKVK